MTDFTAKEPLRSSQYNAARICIAAAVIAVIVMALPPIYPFAGHHGNMLSVHLLLEMFSVIVSVMVVVMACHTYHRSRHQMANTLIFGFSVVACCDIIHALSFEGMPALVTQSSTPKSIYFWLMARSFELLTIWLIATRVVLPGSKQRWLILGVAVGGLLFWFGISHLELFPATYLPGKGLTAFKISYEISLCVGNLLAAGWLYKQGCQQQDPGKIWFATACIITGLSGLFFAGYRNPSDLVNLTGHIFKITAYYLIYRAAFLSAIDEPYKLLEKSEQELLSSLEKNSKLEMALNTHAIVAVTDAHGKITHANDKFCEISQYARHELLGKDHRLINSGTHPKSFFQHMWQTISSGQTWSGEICNRAKDGSLYWVYSTIVPFLDKQQKPSQYIAIRADITERKLAEQRIEQLAFFDELTGLANRRLLRDRFQQALSASARRGDYGALVFVDMDNFKEINNALDHTIGDELLRTVANRLKGCIRQSDTAARFGGDEFVILLNQLDLHIDEASRKAGDIGEKMLQALQAPYYIHDHQLDCTASIGIMLYNGTENCSIDELLKRADIAMYESKAAGCNQLTFFNPQLQAAIEARTALLADLRQALPQQQLRLYYQPIVGQSQQISGVEALIRWQHPQRGMVPPASFIELAEQTGLIIPIGQWVLQTACEQLAKWKTDTERNSWSIAINVSARQFRDPDYPQQVLHTLRQTGAPADRLRLELTESMLLNDMDETIEKMQRLSATGVSFSLDDFGTGYSSLSYLRRLPFNFLKIDRSFINDIFNDANDAAVVRTILSLANNLEMQVVAEGVETAAQFEFLRNNDCHKFQGYLFGKPMPAEELMTIAPQQAIAIDTAEATTAAR